MRPSNGEGQNHPLFPRSVLSPNPPYTPSTVILLRRLLCAEMSLIHSLGPVQNWLGQELEKCGIDAVIYTRYVLSLLLQDCYDYDLQDQENDIFIGWEKGTGKKWNRSRRRGVADVTLEEMKKQAAVQCLRSASDENSEIESLVEELCARLKELQSKAKERGKQAKKKCVGSCSPEMAAVSPSLKDQLEKYNEAFPPLTEKSVCLQEIMTVWNKDKSCASSAVPNAKNDSSISAYHGGSSNAQLNEDLSNIPPSSAITSVVNDNISPQIHNTEKENRLQAAMTKVVEERASNSKRQAKGSHFEGKYRPRSWSSGSSEPCSSCKTVEEDLKKSASKTFQIRHMSNERATTKGRKTRSQGQLGLATKFTSDKEEQKNTTGGGFTKQHLSTDPKKGKRSIKDPHSVEVKDLGDRRNKKEYVEEPLWYTEPLSEYLVPLSCRKSKLETLYRNNPDVSSSDSAFSGDMDPMLVAELTQEVCLASNFPRAYLAAGTFVDGHFIELPDETSEDSAEFIQSSFSPPLQHEENQSLDDFEHLCEFTDFYEVEINPSILDSCASDSVRESRILSMIRQTCKEQMEDVKDNGSVVDNSEENLIEDSGILSINHQKSPQLDGDDSSMVVGISAINTGTTLGACGTEGLLWKDLKHICKCYSLSSSDDVDRDSFAEDSPVPFSPVFDKAALNICELPSKHCSNTSDPSYDDVQLHNSGFPPFDLQCNISPCFQCESVCSCHDTSSILHNSSNLINLDPYGSGKQSRLLLWTKNSAFDGTDYCSNLSTRACSPWSQSGEAHTSIEQSNILSEESALIAEEEITSVIPYIPAVYLEEDVLDFLKDAEEPYGKTSNTVSKTISKLESVCGIQLETEDSEEEQNTMEVFNDDADQQDKDHNTSGIINDIWTVYGDKPIHLEKAYSPNGLGGGFSPENFKNCECSCHEVGLLDMATDLKAEQCSFCNGDLMIPFDTNLCCCETNQIDGSPIQTSTNLRGLQCSACHLWDEEEIQVQQLARNKLSKIENVDNEGLFVEGLMKSHCSDGSYLSSLKSLNGNSDEEKTSFILGGVYGELRSFHAAHHDWTTSMPSTSPQGLLQCAATAAAAASDVVTIAGTDLFMNTGDRFAPGCQRPLRRSSEKIPLVSFSPTNSQVVRQEKVAKGFSLIFHEDIFGACSGFCGREPDHIYPLSSLELNSSHLSQVLRVECCIEPNDMTSLTPGFKPKSILCSSHSGNDIFSSYQFSSITNQTQYRAIRISPRTHFRPISTIELSPGRGSESDVESDKDEHSLPVLLQANLLDEDDLHADLEPLEEDAECEEPYYGKSELESGKFLPRLKKSGMEKSAQTSLDSQEGSSAALAEQNYLDLQQMSPSASGSLGPPMKLSGCDQDHQNAALCDDPTKAWKREA